MGMKGVIDIEFIISAIVFLSIISFVTYVIISGIPVFRNEAFSDDNRAKAYEISQLLMFDEGYPASWNENTVQRLGLSTGERYVLSQTKITSLNTLCGNYQQFKALLGLDVSNEARINITDSGTQLAYCGSTVSTARQEFQITRFAVVNGKIARLVVSVV